MVLSINGNKSNIIYSRGDVALKINPYDNYRLFTLYDDWASSDRKPLDLSNNQKLYLIFKSGKKEIRIPEYIAGYPVDKVNGQVLFKINKKNAVDILSMENKVFYITSVYEILDSSSENAVFSDEEVLYDGLWESEGKGSVESFTTQIKKLNDIVEDRNSTVSELQTTTSELIKQNVELSSQLEELKKLNEEYQSHIDELEKDVAKYQSSETYNGEIITDNAVYYKIASTDQLTEEQMLKLLLSQENTIKQ